MIEIDGSHGEGGGQILRTSISLSAVTGDAIKMTRIRAGRSKPGLQPQHVTSIEAVAEICGAEVEGLYPGSTDIVFKPGQTAGGDFEFDVGTAGSISLVVTSCLLPAALSKAKTTLRIRGGTDVRWSPPIDYLRLVHMPLMNLFGCDSEIVLTSRGFYPEGGGEVSVEILPTSRLGPVDLSTRGKVLRIDGVTYAQNLPEHVVSRMKHSAMKHLLDFKEVMIETDIRRGSSTGAGIVLVAVCENTIIGQSSLGAKGVRAESLGEGCAEDLLDTLRTKATVDEHMLDQILVYMALAGKGCCTIADDLTKHAETNIWVIEKLLGEKFSVERHDDAVAIRTV